jgi:hypothetical protein
MRCIGGHLGPLDPWAQQAPGFCAQKSSNFWALDPAGGGVSLLWLSVPPEGAAAPPPLEAVSVLVPPVPELGAVPVDGAVGEEAVVLGVVPVDPVAPLVPVVAVGVGVGVAVAEPLALSLELGAGGASADCGIGASAYGVGTSGASTVAPPQPARASVAAASAARANRVGRGDAAPLSAGGLTCGGRTSGSRSGPFARAGRTSCRSAGSLPPTEGSTGKG